MLSSPRAGEARARIRTKVNLHNGTRGFRYRTLRYPISGDLMGRAFVFKLGVGRIQKNHNSHGGKKYR